MLENLEYINDFIEEAVVHVETVESGLLKLDTGSSDTENINNIFRAVHSMKGTAGFFGLKKIVELSHALENIFGELRNNRLILDREKIDLLLAANDCLKSMIQDVNNSENMVIRQYVEKLTGILSLSPQHKPEITEISQQIPENIYTNKLSNSMKDLISNGLKHGHKLFKVQISLKEDLDKKDINPINFFKKIETIGTIIDTYTDTSDITALDESLTSNIIFSFLFTTVLEKSLLPLALEIPIRCIQELEANQNKEQLSKIMIEDINKLEDPMDIPLPLQTGTPKEIVKQNQAIPVEDSIRVHVNLLNNLLNLASEMVLGRNQLLRTVEKYRKNIPGLDPILQNIDRITTEMQEKLKQQAPVKPERDLQWLQTK